MGLSCGMKFTRILLFIFNIVFWLLGVTVLGVGIKSRVDGGSWEGLVKDKVITNAANLMIASGIIVAIIGFVGCCGAIKKNTCMLMSYAILIFLIFILEIAAGAYAYTKKDKVEKDLETNLKDVINNSYGQELDADKLLTEAVDWFQQKVECCGIQTYEDWKRTAWYKNTSIPTKDKRQVPRSCCRTESATCNKNARTSADFKKNIYERGCVKAGKDFIKSNLFKIGGVTIGIAVVQLLGIIFACCLCRAIKDGE